MNRLTDLYNAVSVLHQIPLGGEDLTRYAGPPRLIRATGAEPFDTVADGATVVEHPEPGEVVWCDDAGVTCRRWNWRQARRTQLRDDTTDGAVHPRRPRPDDRRRSSTPPPTTWSTHLARLGPDVRVARRLITRRPATRCRRLTCSSIPGTPHSTPPSGETWLAATDRFGMLVVNNLDPAQAPLVLPTHFTLAGDELLLHLARPNPVWPHLEAAAEVRLAVIGDYAYIPTYWRAKAGGPDEDGVPTSYYASVQFVCRPDRRRRPAGQGRHPHRPAGRLPARGRPRRPWPSTQQPYGRMLSGIRGIRLEVLRVEAKFKYDDHNPVEHRERVIDHLEERAHGLDAGAATQQRRRLAAIGDWKTHRKQT